jgi:glycosyltransferase involved in cell wall biosynthesis
MKILISYPDLNFRGGERLFVDFANALKLRNHEVVFITARMSIKARKMTKQIKLITPPPQFKSLFQNNLIFTLISPLFIFISLLSIVRRTDFLYTSESFISLWPVILIGVVFKKQVIVSIFEFGGDNKSNDGIQQINYKLFNAVNILFLKKASFITSINPSIVHLLKKNYGLKNVTFIPAGLDFSLFNKFRNNSKVNKYQHAKKHVIIMPGIIHPVKKQDFALEILLEIKKSIKNIHLIYIGGGNPVHMRNLKELIKSKNLQDNVSIVGLLPEKDLALYYSVAKMTLMCGPIAGLTIIESIFMNTMPIYPTSGVPPLGPSEPFKLGFIINKYESSVFAHKIVEYLKNPDKYTKKLHEDKKIVEKNFDVNYTIEKTLLLIKK